MWVVRLFLFILFLILPIGFAVYNAAERVEVTILSTRWIDVPLVTVVMFAFGAGMIVAFLLAVTYFFKISSEARLNKRESKRLQAEITALRNRQIDEIDQV